MDNLDINALEREVRAAAGFVAPLRQELGKVLVGQDKLVDGLLTGLVANGHVLVEGVPGLAKTLAIKTLAQAIGGSFSRLQFTPDLLPADLLGTSIYHPGDHTFAVKKGPIFANIILADEINRAPAKVQSALLEAMQERQVTLGGETHRLPEPFLVMATQNPIEQEGTYPLPEAQVDRFMLKLVVAYPARDEERRIIERMGHPEGVPTASQVTDLRTIMDARQYMDRIYLDPKITEYILDLVFATRPECRDQLSPRQKEADLRGLDGLIQYGASPRASLALVLAAKARAFIQSRAYVVPQDVKDLAPDVLRHRLILTYEAEAEEITSEKIIDQILATIPVP